MLEGGPGILTGGFLLGVFLLSFAFLGSSSIEGKQKVAFSYVVLKSGTPLFNYFWGTFSGGIRGLFADF